MTTDEALAALAKSRPVRIASYSALLLIVENRRQITHSIKSSFGDCRTTLTPPACWLDEPSVYTIHAAGLSYSSSFAVNLVMKLANAWALITVLGWNSMSNSLSSITHDESKIAWENHSVSMTIQTNVTQLLRVLMIKSNGWSNGKE